MIRISGIFFIAVLVVAICIKDHSRNLLPEYFSDHEIEDLNKLIDFIIEQTSKDCNAQSTECLYQYFDQFKNLSANDPVQFNISQESQKKLLLKIDKNLFEEIWTYCEGTRSVTKDSVFVTRSLCIRSDSRFAQLLEESSKLNSKLEEYYKPFEWVGTYGPSMNTVLIKQPYRFDFNSKHELLIVTVHLLTLNHPVDNK